MNFVAELPVRRRTMSGWIDQIICSDGETREKAFTNVHSYFARANLGRDPRTPLLVKAGKPVIRIASTKEK